MSPAHQEVSVRLERRHAALAESLLLAQGASAVTLTEISDQPMWEPQMGEPPGWEQVRVIGLFDQHSDVAPVKAALSLLPLVEAPEQTVVAEQVWERAWMDRFKPMRFGRNLWIIPTGFEAPDPQADLIHLDPGLAFGTGTHTTTRLCLDWLDARSLQGRCVVDLGCGSGVLGIAAAIKGAAHVLCIDNDPQAVEATRANAERNGVADRVWATTDPVIPPESADVLVANILAATLVALAGDITAAMVPGGRLALSGVLTEQSDEVAMAFSEGFGRLDVHAQGHWVLLDGTHQTIRDSSTLGGR